MTRKSVRAITSSPEINRKLDRLLRATLSARKTNESIGTSVQDGEFRINLVTARPDGRADVTVLESGLTLDQAIAYLEARS